MDELQDRLVTIGLTELTAFGFALAGGYALQAHHLVDRLSEDVDLFTDRWDPDQFTLAVQRLSEAYQNAGLRVNIVRRAATFARFEVTDLLTDRTGLVDMAADVRDHPTASLAIGPVIAEVDAVATKTACVFSRGEARDYIDLEGILASGRYSRSELLELAHAVDGGFSEAIFAQALVGVDRYPDERFTFYGVDPDQVAVIRRAMNDWAEELNGALPDRSAFAPSGHEADARPSRPAEPELE